MSHSSPKIILSIPLLLSACGGGATGPALPIVNPDGAAFASDGETVSFSTDTLNIALPLNPEFDRGPFVGADNLSDDDFGSLLAYSETEDSFAALLLNRSEELGSQTELFFGRTRPVEALPSGTATLTGTYVGSTNDPDSGFLIFFNGDVELDIDLDEKTISGGVENITLPLFGLEGVFSQRIALLETSISRDGSFTGNVQNIEIESGETFDTGTYQGLFAGSDAQEAVGTISGYAVFVAGHEQ